MRGRQRDAAGLKDGMRTNPLHDLSVPIQFLEPTHEFPPPANSKRNTFEDLAAKHVAHRRIDFKGTVTAHQEFAERVVVEVGDQGKETRTQSRHSFSVGARCRVGARPTRRSLADASAGGRVVSVLEGGYDLPALTRSVTAHASALFQGI